MIRGETQVPLHELKRLVQAAGGTVPVPCLPCPFRYRMTKQKIYKYDITDYRVLYKMPFLCTTCRRTEASMVEKVWTSRKGYIHRRRTGSNPLAPPPTKRTTLPHHSPLTHNNKQYPVDFGRVRELYAAIH